MLYFTSTTEQRCTGFTFLKFKNFLFSLKIYILKRSWSFGPRRYFIWIRLSVCLPEWNRPDLFPEIRFAFDWRSTLKSSRRQKVSKIGFVSSRRSSGSRPKRWQEVCRYQERKSKRTELKNNRKSPKFYYYDLQEMLADSQTADLYKFA